MVTRAAKWAATKAVASGPLNHPDELAMTDACAALGVGRQTRSGSSAAQPVTTTRPRAPPTTAEPCHEEIPESSDPAEEEVYAEKEEADVAAETDQAHDAKGEEEHYFDYLVDRRISMQKGARYDYLVHWSAGDETWEPDYSLENNQDQIADLEIEIRKLHEDEHIASMNSLGTSVLEATHPHYQSPRQNREMNHGLTEQRSDNQFNMDLLSMSCYPSDHEDEDLAGLPMSQTEDLDPSYKLPVMRGGGQDHMREMGMDAAESDADGEELAFERLPELSSREAADLQTEAADLGLANARCDVNDLLPPGTMTRQLHTSPHECCI